MRFIGETAALGTAALWSVGSLLFASAARRSGAFALNQFRITLALGFILAIIVATGATGSMPHPGSPGVGWLAVSGVIGLTIGDLGYFGALVRLGPRLTTLLSALSPPITALIAIPMLGEHLGVLAVSGMVLTLGGVLWVGLERPVVEAPAGHRLQGFLLGLLAAVCQAVGFVIAKRGMGETIDPLHANAIRMGAATLGIWTVALFTGRLRAPARIMADKRARWSALGATLVGPTFGVWLSLVAARHTSVGIAATLMATVPVLILPLVIIVYKEKVSPRAAIGAVLTVVGVALIFSRR
jgi:drug/metabolite transporter (DMT)-like permease